MHSAVIKRVRFLAEPRRHFSCNIEALRDKGPAGGERKAKKQATKPAAKPTQNKLPKPSQGSLAAARYRKAKKTSQEAAAFYCDSCAEEAQKKRKYHGALDKKEEIKVRGAHIFMKTSLKRCDKRQQTSAKWEITEQVEQRQMERQEKLRDNIKARRKTKPQTKMSFKKKDHIVPGFWEDIGVLVSARLWHMKKKQGGV
ncbi:hypothetical protein HPB51_010985 [Rhipicephalus microplus]|uniref:Ribosomal RNA-processing protein 14/surfeit locus protein 6 C-terminal domain-containing protein n=1 Tax=Rhipicephalus microplus TaxID=6941 RepID=A0A9J6D9V1_RHIMP|nr:hypothetical protein HPB51_010985 [Rhipicephalus microplus]